VDFENFEKCPNPRADARVFNFSEQPLPLHPPPLPPLRGVRLSGDVLVVWGYSSTLGVFGVVQASWGSDF
jgi:hypothetical protein